MDANTKTIGQRFEKIALNYLLKHRLKLIETNYSCRAGEIDLIMLDGDSLVFIEVRFRTSQAFGGAIESVTQPKQRKLVNAAHTYISAHHLWHQNARFDVIAIQSKRPHWPRTYQINWIKNAFMAV